MENEKNPIKAILWDIDGVIIDSEPLHMRKLTVVAAQNGGQILEEDWPVLHGIGDYNIHGWLQKRFPAMQHLTLSDFLKQCEDYYIAQAETLKARPGFQEAFAVFADAGLPQAAVSSGVRAQVDINLTRAGVQETMIFSLSADDVKKTKPDPEPYLKGLARLNDHFRAAGIAFKPADILVVEDSASGVASGKAAGMQTVLWKYAPVTKDNGNADHILEPQSSLADLARTLISPNI